MEVEYINEELFPPSKLEEGFLFKSLGYDLIIFGRIDYLGESTIANAKAFWMDTYNNGDGQPFSGIVTINNKFDYSVEKSQEFFQSVIIHELTHVLGFSNYFFTNYFHNVLWKLDSNRVNRTYINSTKVLKIARDYFDCPDLDGVALEDYGGTGTVGSHWEARVLLGDYMNGYIHTEEQVISEFTLALLEDTGYYKANYYTGGLMRYGKHKGCSFVRDSCVNKNTHTVDPLFENEFFDTVISPYLYDTSCSSGRQSRTYFFFSYLEGIDEKFSYFEDKTQAGFYVADYCPVARAVINYGTPEYYSYQCSEKGNGKYGHMIPYTNNEGEEFSIMSDYLRLNSGETYSNNSFCFLSSLFKNGTEDADIYSKVTRAFCYNLFCSEKSLTVQINDDYIVCPRAGGKIKVENYLGYFLCPDYNLMCGGTVICNDMFDCVDKKSELKNSSFIYDYEIKTSQNITKADKEEADDINNYELSENGICPIYCKQCKENMKCMNCKNDYGLVGNYDNESIICLEKNELNTGYYKLENNTYYKCMNNCEICSNYTTYSKCNINYDLFNNKCFIPIENCKEYKEQRICSKCKENYAFNKTERNSCINKNNFDDYYTLDDGTSYYPCDETITDCKNCYYNKSESKAECYLCKDDFILVNLENKCYIKDEMDNNRTYYYLNSSHAVNPSCS